MYEALLGGSSINVTLLVFKDWLASTHHWSIAHVCSLQRHLGRQTLISHFGIMCLLAGRARGRGCQIQKSDLKKTCTRMLETWLSG